MHKLRANCAGRFFKVTRAQTHTRLSSGASRALEWRHCFTQCTKANSFNQQTQQIEQYLSDGAFHSDGDTIDRLLHGELVPLDITFHIELFLYRIRHVQGDAAVGIAQTICYEGEIRNLRGLLWSYAMYFPINRRKTVEVFKETPPSSRKTTPWTLQMESQRNRSDKKSPHQMEPCVVQIVPSKTIVLLVIVGTD